MYSSSLTGRRIRPGTGSCKRRFCRNTLDRYDDLVAQGVSEGTAYAQAVDQLGDVSKLWEAGPKKQGRHRGGLGLLRWDLSGAAETLKEVGRQTAGKATVRYGEPETYTAGARSHSCRKHCPGETGMVRRHGHRGAGKRRGH